MGRATERGGMVSLELDASELDSSDLAKRCARRPTPPKGYTPAKAGWLKVRANGRTMGWMTAEQWKRFRRWLRLRGIRVGSE
ncbi:MAG: hypothetical protein AAGE52_19735 [Myxococcota bacterium]